MKEEWFKDWFNSNYYHMLYKHRDDYEAATFIKAITTYLNPNKNAKMLDLACGRGRHSVTLNSLGFDVTGLDLSEQNIKFASQFGNEHLRFDVHDMRNVYRKNSFDYIFNLFTSFGYFQSDVEDKKVLSSVHEMLTENGTFVFDYLNIDALKIDSAIVEKTIDNVKFSFKKERKEDYILKTITVQDQDELFTFYEKVCAISQEEFLAYFNLCNLQIQQIFGDYQLNDFDLLHSPRIIIIAKKC